MIIPHLFKQIAAIMSSGGQGDKPGKVNWPARDWRYFGAKPKTQPKPQPKPKPGREWTCVPFVPGYVAVCHEP